MSHMSPRGVLHLVTSAAFNHDTDKYSLGFHNKPDADAFIKLSNIIITSRYYNKSYSGFNINRQLNSEETGKDRPEFKLTATLGPQDVGNIDRYITDNKIPPQLPYFLNNARIEQVNENPLHIIRISNKIILTELDKQIEKFRDIDFNHNKVFEENYFNGKPTADIIMGSRTSCIRLNDAAMQLLQDRTNAGDSPSSWAR